MTLSSQRYFARQMWHCFEFHNVNVHLFEDSWTRALLVCIFSIRAWKYPFALFESHPNVCISLPLHASLAQVCWCAPGRSCRFMPCTLPATMWLSSLPPTSIGRLCRVTACGWWSSMPPGELAPDALLTPWALNAEGWVILVTTLKDR